MKQVPDIWNAWESQRIRDCVLFFLFIFCWWLVVCGKIQASRGAAQNISTECCLECIQVFQQVWRLPPEISSARQLKVNTCATVGRWSPSLPAGWDTAASPQYPKTHRRAWDSAPPDLQAQRFFETVTRLKVDCCGQEWGARRDSHGEKNGAESMTVHTHKHCWLDITQLSLCVRCKLNSPISLGELKRFFWLSKAYVSLSKFGVSKAFFFKDRCTWLDNFTPLLLLSHLCWIFFYKKSMTISLCDIT